MPELLLQQEFLPELIAYTGPRYEFETRINSLNVLRKLNYLDPAAAGNAITWTGALIPGGALTFRFTATHTGAPREMVTNTATRMKLM